MKWFKHQTDASESGEFISELESIFGLEGYARWFKLLEKVGYRMDKTDLCSAAYPWSDWQRFLRGKRKKLETFLEHCQNKGKISYSSTGNILEIKIPNLLIIRDNHSKNLQAADKRLASKEVDKDIEADKDKDVSAEPLKKDSEQPAESSPVFITFPLQKSGDEHQVTEADVEAYKISFPRLDVGQVLRNMAQWYQDSPTKRKTSRGIRRAISSWMMRDQDSGKNLLQSGAIKTGKKQAQFPLDVECKFCGKAFTIMSNSDYCPVCGENYYEYKTVDRAYHEREAPPGKLANVLADAKTLPEGQRPQEG